MKDIDQKAIRSNYIITITKSQTLPEEKEELIQKASTNESLKFNPGTCQDSEDRKDEVVSENKSENHKVTNDFPEGRCEIIQTLSPPSVEINGRGSISTNSRVLKLDPKFQKALDARPPEKIDAGSCSCLIF